MTVPIQQPTIDPYRVLRAEFALHRVRADHVPVEYAVSLPMPTLRWTKPSIAGFAGPAARTPGRPLRLAPPDRWWAVDIHSRELVCYALTEAVPFGLPADADSIEVDHGDRTIEAMQENLRTLDELMDRAIGHFFHGTTSEPAVRADLTAVLAAAVTDSALPWYRALAPDFFSWLDGGTR